MSCVDEDAVHATCAVALCLGRLIGSDVGL
jgi:hypothetical protein